MGMDTQITVSDFLAVRQEVADVVKRQHPRSEKVLEVAEALIGAGVIDVEYVRDRIHKRQEAQERNRAQQTRTSQSSPADAARQAKP